MINIGANGGQSIDISGIIANCVAAVSDRILPQLIEANPNIQSLSYMFGHPLELRETLREMESGKTTKYKKFPVVMLFADVITAPTSVRGSEYDVVLNIIIAQNTLHSIKAAERITKNFIPILRPIYEELIKQLFRCGYFWIQTPRELQGRQIERLYWGREGIQGNDQNKYEDCIDAIEIKGLKLNLCKKINSSTQSTFMQLVEYFLLQTRATITIVSVAENKIYNAFFLNKITEITAATQDYIADVDFTQEVNVSGAYTGYITGVNINFYPELVIIAKR